MRNHNLLRHLSPSHHLTRHGDATRGSPSIRINVRRAWRGDAGTAPLPPACLLLPAHLLHSGTTCCLPLRRTAAQRHLRDGLTATTLWRRMTSISCAGALALAAAYRYAGIKALNTATHCRSAAVAARIAHLAEWSSRVGFIDR